MQPRECVAKFSPSQGAGSRSLSHPGGLQRPVAGSFKLEVLLAPQENERYVVLNSYVFFLCSPCFYYLPGILCSGFHSLIHKKQYYAETTVYATET